MSSETTNRPDPADFDLNLISVRKPCHEDWERMTGDDRARFCDKCEKTVFNISAMTEAAAKQLILDKGGNLCVQYRRRADGTVVTASCPTGALGLTGRRWGQAAAAATLALSALLAGAAQAGDKQTVADPNTDLDALRQELLATQGETTACEPLPEDAVMMTYTVKDGDSLVSISRQWNSQVDWINAVNDLPSDGTLTVGQKLQVPMRQMVRGRVASPQIAPAMKGKMVVRPRGVVGPAPSATTTANPQATPMIMGEVAAPTVAPAPAPAPVVEMGDIVTPQAAQPAPNRGAATTDTTDDGAAE